MAKAKKAAQVMREDIPALMTIEQHHAAMADLRERLAAMEQQGTERLQGLKGWEMGLLQSVTGPLAQLPPAQPSKEWCVRQAQEDKGLAELLNGLAQEGWQVYAIFEPRGGAYRVVAWRVIQ